MSRTTKKRFIECEFNWAALVITVTILHLILKRTNSKLTEFEEWESAQTNAHQIRLNSMSTWWRFVSICVLNAKRAPIVSAQLTNEASVRRRLITIWLCAHFSLVSLLNRGCTLKLSTVEQKTHESLSFKRTRKKQQNIFSWWQKHTHAYTVNAVDTYRTNNSHNRCQRKFEFLWLD